MGIFCSVGKIKGGLVLGIHLVHEGLTVSQFIWMYGLCGLALSLIPLTVIAVVCFNITRAGKMTEEKKQRYKQGALAFFLSFVLLWPFFIIGMILYPFFKDKMNINKSSGS
jgi:ABC-type dipeptide/oligopeptide/nickel transport system permease component